MIVGADVNSKNAVVVAVNGRGGLSADLPTRFEPSRDSDDSERLAEFIERVAQRLRDVGATAVVLTVVDERRARPSTVRATAYLEAGLMLAARKAGAAVEKMHQRSIGTSLGLPASASKTEIRKAVQAQRPSIELSPDPDRRARALAAAWAQTQSPEEG